MIVGFQHDNIHEFILFTQFDRDDATLLWTTVRFEFCLLHDPFFGGHHEEVTWQIEIANNDAITDLFIRRQVQQIHDSPPTAFPTHLRDFPNLLPIDFSLIGEEQQVSMRTGHKQMLDWIFLFRS